MQALTCLLSGLTASIYDFLMLAAIGICRRDAFFLTAAGYFYFLTQHFNTLLELRKSFKTLVFLVEVGTSNAEFSFGSRLLCKLGYFHLPAELDESEGDRIYLWHQVCKRAIGNGELVIGNW